MSARDLGMHHELVLIDQPEFRQREWELHAAYEQSFARRAKPSDEEYFRRGLRVARAPPMRWHRDRSCRITVAAVSRHSVGPLACRRGLAKVGQGQLGPLVFHPTPPENDRSPPGGLPGSRHRTSSKSRGNTHVVKRLCTSLITAVVAAITFAPAASAAGTTIPSICDDGQAIELVFNGGGNFTPGHFVGGTATYVTQSIDATREFTPTGGVTIVSQFSVMKPHVVGDIVTCNFDFVRATPTGTFHAFGTSTFFITPAS